jgi:D-alanyl-lipoteichoic acid acyltransferase DltB (MBOAT superfamily)
MLFNSHPFILLFLPSTLIGFFLLARVSRCLAASWLVAASLVFYGWWDLRYVPLLLTSIVFNYAFGLLIARCDAAQAVHRRRLLLVVGVSLNLAMLAYFKYKAFGVELFSAIAGHVVSVAPSVLPLGISFFTFTQIAFLVACTN